MNAFGKTYTLYKSSFDVYPDSEARELYKQAYQDACKHFACKKKVDDGSGGTGWKFFESLEDMRIWKNQK